MYNKRIGYRNVRVQSGDIKRYYYLVSFHRNIPDVVGKCRRIFSVDIFIFNISFENVSCVQYLLRLHNGEPLHETIGYIGTPTFLTFS